MKEHTLQVKKAVLVYQNGISNVFAVDCYNLSNWGRNAVRLFQGDFRGGVLFCRGLASAGTGIKTAACSKAGDIACLTWDEAFDSHPFCTDFRIIDENNKGYSD